MLLFRPVSSPKFLGRQAVMEEGGIVPHGIEDVDHGGQDLVIDFDQGEGLIGRLLIDRRHAGDGVAAIEHFVARQDVIANVLETSGPFAQINHIVLIGRGKIVRRDDRPHPLQSLGSGGVDGPNAGMGVGTPQNLAVKHAGQPGVAPVDRLAGDLVGAVVTNRARSDYFVLPVILCRFHLTALLPKSRILSQVSFRG